MACENKRDGRPLQDTSNLLLQFAVEFIFWNESLMIQATDNECEEHLTWYFANINLCIISSLEYNFGISK